MVEQVIDERAHPRPAVHGEVDVLMSVLVELVRGFLLQCMPSFFRSILSETHLLFKELIMDVTIFFRNPDAFESLKAILKKKFPHPWTRERFEGLGDRPPHRRRGLFDRIILKELMEQAEKEVHVQIFRSDSLKVNLLGPCHILFSTS